ncbi:MAG: hypothetical protein SYC29_18705 [Planctomycetota bacterium]|nr:hypothetical protein [Planctomycetota bacterium]
MTVCVSSRGGAAVTDPSLPQDTPRSAMLDAVASFALDPQLPGAPALGYLPKRIRTSPGGGEIAGQLEAAMRDLGVEVEIKTELPILEGLASFLDEQASSLMDEGGAPHMAVPGIMRTKGMTVERVRAFADAASIFFKARPWTRFPNEVLWRVEPKPRTRALSHFTIMGGGGEEFGLGFLTSPTDMMRMIIQDDPSAFLQSRRTTMWSVTFEDIGTLPMQDADLWERESLPVAAENGYPIPAGFTPSGKVRRPTPEQLDYLEGVLRAAAHLTPDHARGESVAMTVRTHDGERSLRLRVAADFSLDAGGA